MLRQFNDFSRLWIKDGLHNDVLSKASIGKQIDTSTSWIWNLHADVHDYDIQMENCSIGIRKVFSSNLAHISTVSIWLSGMIYHGAYFSNYGIWLKDPKHYLPSIQLAVYYVGQEILNSDVGDYYQGIYKTAGVCNLWHSERITGNFHLKYSIQSCITGITFAVFGSYFHIHISWLSVHFFHKFNSLFIHHLVTLFSLGCISWCGHQIHISYLYV